MKNFKDIENLTVQELIDLNEKVIRRLKELKSQEERKAATQFRINDIVSFTTRDNKKIIGFVTSTRKSKISIFTEDNEKWNVPPTILSPEEKPSKKLLKILEDLLPPSVCVKASTRQQS
ncbi:MAG: hypothetical protein ACOH2E_03865 [Candidatus Paracaedibacter sp.]